MDIDIESLSESELIALNHRIVERLKTMRQQQAQQKMQDFKIGQPVWFESPEGNRISGMLTRYNQKTVTIITEDGRRWNVSPGFVKPETKTRPQRKGSRSQPRRSKSSEGFNILDLPG